MAGMVCGVVILWLAYRAEGTRRQHEASQRQRLAARSAGRTISAAEDIFRTTPRLNPGQQQVLAGVLADSLELLETLRREDITDPEVRRQTAVAYLRLGHVRGRLKQGAECVGAYRQSLALFKDLAREFPDDRDDRDSVFYLTFTLASALTAQSEEQRPLRREALAVLEPLTREDPANPAYRDALAHLTMHLGDDCFGAEQFGDAEADGDHGAGREQRLHPPDHQRDADGADPRHLRRHGRDARLSRRHAQRHSCANERDADHRPRGDERRGVHRSGRL